VILDLLDRYTEVGPRAVIARANPAAKLAVALLVPLALVVTVDVVTAGTALLLEVLALPWCGLGPRALLRSGWIVLLGAIPTGVLTLFLAPDSGDVLVPAGILTVTTGSATAALAITLRILAIGLPGVVLVATTDPTDLADALAQVVHLPHRFVLSALAALRLFGVLAEEWRMLGLARRARGLGDDGVTGKARIFAGQVFALLVIAIRRGTILATAMEARGFGAARRRTWARPSRFGARDWAVTAGGLAIAATATAAGLAAGTWQLVLA
jgi:energy-coupling factor transport system permease protein